MAFHYLEINTFSLLYEEINKIFRELQGLDHRAEGALDTIEVPSVDIYETEEAVFVEVEAPGVDPDRVKISFTQGTLIIEGFKEEEITADRLNYICMERSFGRFQRVIPINQPVDLEKSEGKYHQGIFSIRLNKMIDRRGQKQLIKIHKAKEEEGTVGREG
jgi:HSP20 family protein